MAGSWGNHGAASSGGFGNPQFGGNALRQPAITSPNFNLQNPASSPVPSWGLLNNGTAYFNKVIINGAQVPAVESDSSVHTVTQTTTHPLTKAWPISDVDLADNTVYRLTVWGRGIWGNPAATLTTSLTVFGQEFGPNTPVGAAALPVGAGFNFSITYIAQITATGILGSTQVTATGVISTTDSNVLQASTIAFSWLFAQPIATSTSTITAGANWSSTAGSSTITGDGSLLELMGQAP